VILHIVTWFKFLLQPTLKLMYSVEIYVHNNVLWIVVRVVQAFRYFEASPVPFISNDRDSAGVFQEVGHISTVRWKHKCISTSTFLSTTPRGKTESQSLASNSQIPSRISYPVSEFWNNKCCWTVPVVWSGHILCEVNVCPQETRTICIVRVVSLPLGVLSRSLTACIWRRVYWYMVTSTLGVLFQQSSSFCQLGGQDF
jgi:hypothetical protein